MTIKEFYEKAKAKGKEEYEIITVKMDKDRKCRWFKLIPRYGIRGNVVFMEIGGVMENETMTELEPCPFCGREATSIEKYDYSSYPWHWIECTNCDARTNKFLTEKEAIEAWNKRVPLTNGFTNNIPPTNEQWFDGLSTEEKAKRIINIAVNSDCDYRAIVKWLKEKHESGEK